MIKHTCKNCNIEFNSYDKNRLFCGRKCRSEFAYIIKKCISCDNDFKSYKHVKHSYCSTKCSNSRSNNYKGGRIITPSGYIKIWQPHHPSATDKLFYILEHRLVMEKKIGRFLTKDEVVHHIDGNKQNNDISNLQLFSSHSEHMKDHGFNRGIKYWGQNAKLNK